MLDEPTVGLDPIARSDVWEYISRLRERAGMTVLMTTHYMDEADLYCDRVALMHIGRVAGHGQPGEPEGLCSGRTPRWTRSSATSPAGRWTRTPRREASVTSVAPGAPPAVSADYRSRAQSRGWRLRQLASRMVTLCWVELRKLRHDRTELYTRAIQPALWLLIFGETFTRIHAIPTPDGIPYLAYLAPGILAQSALFVSIFYGIQIIWERDAGVLTKLMVTPTPAPR